ncbi:nuclease-related domain-containing protein [Sutcliffiella horikoshii]|uniref:nuclease-related domain-containing protein n=1 Tax=Sutcliffiella horikoshii TaxID=79883 RepID=UPI001F3A07AA|nr:nuclease-related domain-containing protein [Sutcliffiella horikoshii]MCG1022110.1 NERD domain-containing protein [Sutcliffiella horikoshii]
MIIKPLEKPLTIKKLEALLRRIDKNHPKRPQIEQDLAKRLAGYKGEQSMEYHLSFLDERKFYILHALRLQSSSNYYFQMDVLLLTSKYFLIIEIKNIIGQVTFENHFAQFIRTLNGIEEGFYNPLDQVKKQKLRLDSFIESQKIKRPPIKSLVCFTNPQTIIRSDSRVKASQYVMHAHNLFSKLEQLNQQFDSSNFTEKELLKISRKLLKQHCEENVNILERYDINRNEILKGVQCPGCSNIPLNRQSGSWFCEKCNLKSKNAHIATLEDYRLLWYQHHPSGNKRISRVSNEFNHVENDFLFRTNTLRIKV